MIDAVKGLGVSGDYAPVVAAHGFAGGSAPVRRDVAEIHNLIAGRCKPKAQPHAKHNSSPKKTEGDDRRPATVKLPAKSEILLGPTESQGPVRMLRVDGRDDRLG